MAKIYKVVHSDSLPDFSDDNDSRYVGIRSNAAKKWLASPFNSSYIKLEEIDAADGLNEFHETKYNFIFEVNAADYANFLKVANAKRGFLSHKDMNDSENLAIFLKKLKSKGFIFKKQDALSSMRKLSTAAAMTLPSGKGTETKTLTIASSIVTEPSIPSYSQRYIEEPNALLSRLNQLRQKLAANYDSLNPSVQGLLSKSELEVEISIIESEIAVDTLKSLQDRAQLVQQKIFQQHALAKSVFDKKNQEFTKAVTEIYSIKKYLQQDNNELVTLELGLNLAFKKSKQLLKGLTSYFFSDISREKQIILHSILERREVIQNINAVLSTSAIPEEINLNTIKSKLADINDVVDEENLKILRKVRGFTFFGLRIATTTSDQIALDVKDAANALESKIDKLASQVSVVNGR